MKGLCTRSGHGRNQSDAARSSQSLVAAGRSKRQPSLLTARTPRTHRRSTNDSLNSMRALSSEPPGATRSRRPARAASAATPRSIQSAWLIAAGQRLPLSPPGRAGAAAADERARTDPVPDRESVAGPLPAGRDRDWPYSTRDAEGPSGSTEARRGDRGDSAAPQRTRHGTVPTNPPKPKPRLATIRDRSPRPPSEHALARFVCLPP